MSKMWFMERNIDPYSVSMWFMEMGNGIFINLMSIMRFMKISNDIFVSMWFTEMKIDTFKVSM